MGKARRSIPGISIILTLLLALGAGFGCSDDDNPAAPDPEPSESELTVSQLAVAGVVGHESTFDVALSGGTDKAIDLTVECSDPADRSEPELNFLLDATIESAARIEGILKELADEERDDDPT